MNALCVFVNCFSATQIQSHVNILCRCLARDKNLPCSSAHQISFHEEWEFFKMRKASKFLGFAPIYLPVNYFETSFIFFNAGMWEIGLCKQTLFLSLRLACRTEVASWDSRFCRPLVTENGFLCPIIAKPTINKQISQNAKKFNRIRQKTVYYKPLFWNSI